MKDDDEEEENTFGVTRYPCMPSLVALQQMRNRLHLAFLGRKLMKWTMLASGRELRRLAIELDGVYKGFAEELRNAYIQLARSRYYHANLNEMVLEDIPKKAGAIVIPSTKSVSGVKLWQYVLEETEYKPYVHLGIGKGGQTILETKKAWLELLKHLITMMTLRTSFRMVEISNRAATKKMNVLGKIVIPRTNVTMAYINNELEELAREEFFRLKKVLEIKKRIREGKVEKNKATKPMNEDEPKRKKNNNLSKPMCIVCGEIIKDLGPVIDKDQKLVDLEIQLSDIIKMTEDLNKDGLLTADVKDFMKIAGQLKRSLEFKSNVNIEEICDNCKLKLIEEHEAQSHSSELSEPSTSNIPPLDNTSSLHVIDVKTTTTLKEVSKDTLKSVQIPQPGTSSIRDAPVPVLTPVPTTIQDPATLNLELGVFEEEIKEITKIIRVKNEDGTVTEEKKVIKIKREVKAPSRGNASQTTSNDPNAQPSNQPSQTSGKSNPYSGSRTIGLVSISSCEDPKSRSNLKKKTKSEPIIPSSPASETTDRFCVSSITLLSTDLDFDY
ncbi:unnamed protein product, partial [Leptidea sinapis]